MPRARRSQRERGRRALVAVLFLLLGLAVAWAAVRFARHVGAPRDVQQAIAFFCIAGTLLFLTLNQRARPEDPVAAVATLVTLAVAGVGALNTIGPIERDPGRGCILSDGPIKGTIGSDKTIIFAKANFDSDPRGLLLSGCNLGFVGYCIGAVHPDAAEPDVVDSRWLILSGHQGLVPSGQVVGTTPRRPPDRCPGNRPVPDRVAFKAAVLDPRQQQLTLSAQSPGAAMIGFSLRLPDGRWRRIGWDRGAADDQPLRVPVPSGLKRGSVVAASACVAFQRPGRATATATVGVGRASGTLQTPGFDEPIHRSPAQAGCDASTTPVQ
jgi:hypothetical protein